MKVPKSGHKKIWFQIKIWKLASLAATPLGGATQGWGVGTILLISDFFIQFSIGLRWILQIRLLKFWKFVILRIKTWKLQIRRGAALHPTQNNCIFKFRLEYFYFTSWKCHVISHWITVQKTHGKCELPMFIGSEKAIPTSSGTTQCRSWSTPSQLL